jgi:hypothetical protein
LSPPPDYNRNCWFSFAQKNHSTIKDSEHFQVARPSRSSETVVKSSASSDTLAGFKSLLNHKTLPCNTWQHLLGFPVDIVTYIQELLALQHFRSQCVEVVAS